MKKLGFLPFLLGIAAFAGIAAASNQSKPSRVTGKSGQSWDVQLEGVTGETKTYAVYAPVGSVGNTTPLFVARYQQTGSDTVHRPLIAAGKSAQGPLTNYAISDFGLQAPAGVVPLI